MKTSSLSRSASKDRVVEYFNQAVSDASMQAADDGAEDLFTEGDLPVSVSNDAANRLIHAGLRATLVVRVAKALGEIDKAALLKTIGIDKATLRRREKSKKPLDRAQAEATVRTIELMALATETFGTLEKAEEWLAKPHPLLDGQAPIARAGNQYGAEQVKAMLAAIRYGGVV